MAVSIAADAAERLGNLGRALDRLSALPVDYDDADQAGAYYEVGRALIAELLAGRARDLGGLRAKAEAVAWCCASRSDFALGDTVAERAIQSLLRDILALEL